MGAEIHSAFLADCAFVTKSEDSMKGKTAGLEKGKERKGEERKKGRLPKGSFVSFVKNRVTMPETVHSRKEKREHCFQESKRQTTMITRTSQVKKQLL